VNVSRRILTLCTLASVIPLASSGTPAGAQKPASSGRQTLAEVDAAALRQAIAKRKGKVVFVNMWATWCAPCVAEFPDMVKLYRKYHDQGLEVIAVSFDDEAAAALPFLSRQQADFTNFLKNRSQEVETFAKGFSREWSEKGMGALPASWVYDRKGEQKYFTMGRFDPAVLDRLLADLTAGR